MSRIWNCIFSKLLLSHSLNISILLGAWILYYWHKVKFNFYILEQKYYFPANWIKSSVTALVIVNFTHTLFPDNNAPNEHLCWLTAHPLKLLVAALKTAGTALWRNHRQVAMEMAPKTKNKNGHSRGLKIYVILRKRQGLQEVKTTKISYKCSWPSEGTWNYTYIHTYIKGKQHQNMKASPLCLFQ